MSLSSQSFELVLTTTKQQNTQITQPKKSP